MAKKKVKTEKIKFESVLTEPPLQAERDRLRTELAWLDTKFFIPIDFNLIKKGNKLIKGEVTAEKAAELSPEIQQQYEYFHHNQEVMEMILEHEQLHNLTIFKYINYNQMIKTYIEGTMTKAELDKIKPKLIKLNEKCLNPLQFAYIADATMEYRQININAAKIPIEKQRKSV